MRILKVLSALLSYPGAELIKALDEIEALIDSEDRLTDKSELKRLIAAMRESDLIDLQEDYVALFDKGHSFSLHIFEHVHGQSRDRGQAMVNLMQLYQTNGFEIATKELPDYIPLFLEFLSLQPHKTALSVLNDAMPVLSLLNARLVQNQSPYQAIFDALHQLTGTDQTTCEPVRDETLERMDEIWEEEAVSFMANACQNAAQTESPVTFKPRKNHQANGELL